MDINKNIPFHTLKVCNEEVGEGIALPILIHNGDCFVSNGFFFNSDWVYC